MPMEPKTPTEQELLNVVTILRQIYPHLGRAKFLAMLKEKYAWILSENRLKKFMGQHDLNAEPEGEVTNYHRGAVYKMIVKKSFEDYKVRERTFLLNLSPYQRSRLNIPAGHASPQTFAACHLRHHIEFLFALKGLKPCVLFCGCSFAPDVFGKLVEDCLMPVIEEYKLERYGFHLQQITHSMPTKTTPRNFQGSWVFADIHSTHWPEVKKMLLTPKQGSRTNEKRLGVILGYPTADGTKYFRGVDYTEMEDLKRATPHNVCCVTAYGFGCPPGSNHYQDIMDHYYRCRDAAEEVGVFVRQDLQRHPDLMRYWDGLFLGPKMADFRARHHQKR